MLLSTILGAEQRSWTIDDILNTEQIVCSRISPNGNLVFFQTGTTSEGYPVRPSTCYLSDRQGSTQRLPISNFRKSSDPFAKVFQWLPDSKQISYLGKDADGIMQVWKFSINGEKQERITSSSHNIIGYSWSERSSKLVYICSDPVSEEEIEYIRTWGKVLSPEEPTWQRTKTIRVVEGGKEVDVEKNVVLHNEPLWSPDGRFIAYIKWAGGKSALTLCNMQDGGSKLVFSGDGRQIHSFSWSPDSRRIAYIETSNVNPDYVNFQDGNPVGPGTVCMYDLKSGVSTMLTSQKFPETTELKWSRDSRRVDYIARDPSTIDSKLYSRYLAHYIFVIDTKGGSVSRIAERTDFFLGGENLTWSADNSEIWFGNGNRTNFDIFAVNVKSGITRILSGSNGVVGQLTFDKDFRTAAYIYSNANLKSDIRILDIRNGKEMQITDLNPWVRDMDNERGEVITYKSDGWDIDALLIKPPHFDPNRKYPLLLVVHGGPNWYKLNEWVPDWEQYPIKALAAQDIVLVFPNFRGSANYGPEFRQAAHLDIGGCDYKDAMGAVDLLLGKGFIDEKNMGVCGWSYGGYLTPSIITQTDRFKAAQFGAGLPSVEAMYSSLWTVERILTHNLEGRPWEDGTRSIKYSPLYHTDKVVTPTLIQHGEYDPRCPVGEAVLFYKALKSYGVPSVLEIYPKMGHSITDGKLYRRAVTRNLEWFCKWLKDDTTTSFERIFPKNQ